MVEEPQIASDIKRWQESLFSLMLFKYKGLEEKKPEFLSSCVIYSIQRNNYALSTPYIK
jgi:hypothetical protein